MAKCRIVMRYQSGVTSYVVQRRFLFIWNDVEFGDGEAGYFAIQFDTLKEAKEQMWICLYGSRPDVVLKVELEQ